MAIDPQFQNTFAECREILRELEPKLILNTDEPGNYSLDAGYSARHKKVIWFGGVRIGKGYVSYHLMPVYGCPDLVRDMPDELRRRMQGKSCFNFKSITPKQARMLRDLTLESYERFKRGGYVSQRAVAGTENKPVTSPTPGPSARSGGGYTRPTSPARRGARRASANRPTRR